MGTYSVSLSLSVALSTVLVPSFALPLPLESSYPHLAPLCLLLKTAMPFRPPGGCPLPRHKASLPSLAAPLKATRPPYIPRSPGLARFPTQKEKQTWRLLQPSVLKDSSLLCPAPIPIYAVLIRVLIALSYLLTRRPFT